MQFTKIDLQHVRIIESAQLETTAGINLLYGSNGSGKTSVLEAIHVLSRGKSFRSPRIQELIQRGKSELMVLAEAKAENQQEIKTGLRRENKQTHIKFQGETVHSSSQQALNIPVFLQTTESHVLLTGTPKRRRKRLDWFLFHVEPNYLLTWKKYHTALRNRNTALRKNSSNAELMVWEEQMEKYGVETVQKCQSVTDSINDVFCQKLTHLLGISGKLVYQPGWDTDINLRSLLESNRKQDRDRGYSGAGPHRADIEFFCEDELAVKNLSRGQSKLYLTALLLAEQDVLSQRTGKSPVLLFDDVAAELDTNSRQTVYKELQNSGLQSFVSTTEADDRESQVSAMFHVERGSVKKC